MSTSRSDLVVADFLDGAEARAFTRRDDVRRIAKLLVDSCFEEIGVEPRLLDGDQARELLLSIVARKLGSKDPLIELVPRVARAFFGHLAVTAVVPNAFEIDGALADIDDEFVTAARTLPGDQRIGGKPQTIVNRADKVGRNDPCPCGSGKKFKQCCARIS